MRTHLRRYVQRWLVLGLAVLFLAGCDNLFHITNPGFIEADDLDELAGLPGLVVGMSGDLSVALKEVATDGSIMSREHRNGATQTRRGIFETGQIPFDQVNSYWTSMHRARWVAEDGIKRLERVLGEAHADDVLTVRSYLFAGFSNRILGEHVCQAVVDGGPPEAFTAHFERAEVHFTEAIRLADRQGETGLGFAARAGRAQVRAALGDWSGAVQDAGTVPLDYLFEAVYSDNTEREWNEVYSFTQRAGTGLTVYGTEWFDVEDDPRVPWSPDLDDAGEVRPTADGNLPGYRQDKYLSRSDGIPLAKGTDMRLLEAEALLRSGDLVGAFDRINEARSVHGLPPLAVAASEGEAWTVLMHERGAELWLEARRLWDLRRWYEEGRNDVFDNRDSCIPISQHEREGNPNLS